MRDTTNTDDSQRYMRGIQLPGTDRAGESREGQPRRGTRREPGRPSRDQARSPRAQERTSREAARRRTSPTGTPSRRGQARRRPRPTGPSLVQGILRARPSLPPAALVVLVAVVAVILGSSYLFRPQGSTETVPVDTGSQTTGAETDDATEPGGDDTGQDVTEEPQNESTPRSEWKQGEMPYLYQTDPQYADATYSNGTFAKQGCGPTALATVYIYLTGDTSMGPLEMAEFSTENGFSTDGNGSSWTLMSDGAAMLGLSSETLPAVPARLAEALESGHPLICVMAPGTFTEVGHYITLERLDEDGKAVVHDSNSVERSSQTWDLELICSEAVNIWSFSVA